MLTRIIRRKIIQVRIFFCNSHIDRISRKIAKLNARRESIFATRRKLVSSINQGPFAYLKVRDIEKTQSSQITKIDYEAYALQQSIAFLDSKIDRIRSKIFIFNKSL